MRETKRGSKSRFSKLLQHSTKMGIALLLTAALSACAASNGNITPTPTAASNATDAGNEQQTQNNEQQAQEGESAIAADAVIASLSIHITNNLLAIGIKPAGSAIGGGVGDFLPHVASMLEGTAKLGKVTDPNMEAVLELEPDYIFTDTHFGGETVASLEKIAPVIAMDSDIGSWKEHLLETASLFDRKQQAEQFIEQYEQQAENVKQLISSELGENPKVVAVRVTGKELRAQSMNRPVGPILYEDLALQPVDALKDIAEGEPYAVISREILPELDPDAIFLIVNNDDDAKRSYDELQGNAVWKNLRAVKNDHVYVLDGQTWLDYSALGQKMALDDAEKLFTAAQ